MLQANQREINLRRRRITVILSQICLNYGLKWNQRQGCGNSFGEAVPLRDSAQKGMLLVLDAVEGYVKGTGGGLLTTFFPWFPDVGACFKSVFCRPFLNLYSFVSLAFFLLDCSNGQSSCSSMAVMLDVSLLHASGLSQWGHCRWWYRGPIQDWGTPWVVSLELCRLLPSPCSYWYVHCA